MSNLICKSLISIISIIFISAPLAIGDVRQIVHGDSIKIYYYQYNMSNPYSHPNFTPRLLKKFPHCIFEFNRGSYEWEDLESILKVPPLDSFVLNDLYIPGHTRVVIESSKEEIYIDLFGNVVHTNYLEIKKLRKKPYTDLFVFFHKQGIKDECINSEDYENKKHIEHYKKYIQEEYDKF